MYRKYSFFVNLFHRRRGFFFPLSEFVSRAAVVVNVRVILSVEHEGFIPHISACISHRYSSFRDIKMAPGKTKEPGPQLPHRNE